MPLPAAPASRPPPRAGSVSRPPAPNGQQAAPAAASKSFAVSSGISRTTHKIGIYGKGGAGKTSLVALLATIGFKPVFLDIDHGAADHDVARIDGIETWDDLRNVLQNAKLLAPYDCIVIDTVTVAEEMATAWTLRNVPNDKGQLVKNLKKYGWNQGPSFVFETFMGMLADLDVLARTKNIVLVMHACEGPTANPAGADFLSWQPRLTKESTCDIRSKVRDWLDHLFFIEMEHIIDPDTKAGKTAKALGGVTRIIHCVELGYAWAKSRTLRDPIVFPENDATLWKTLFGRSE